MIVKCVHCGKDTEKSTGHYNRAMKLGAKLFCSLKCCGLNHRINESNDEKVFIKSLYDLFLRISRTDEEVDLEYLQNAVAFQLDYKVNTEKYKEIRRKRMPFHIMYCKQPKYKKYKQRYDEQYRAKKFYGEYWEAAIVLKNLENEIDARQAKRENKIYNKSIKRKRLWQKMLNQTSNLPPLI
jgi:hypothetical protein